MAQPKSMYLRQVTVMLGLIILCMTLLGAGFFSLSYRYQLQEIQSTLDRNAGFISDYASVALTEGSSLTDKDFVNYIQSVVLLTDTTVLVCNTEGMVVCAAGTNWNQELLTSGEVSIPAWATNQLLSGRSYSGMTTFDGIFNTRCYVTSEILSPLVRDQNTGELVSSNVPTGFLFVANDATSVMEFLQHTFQLFFITAIAVLLITLIICSFTVQKMVDPLKSMCSFAHRFARGEVDVRITDYKNRNDEIGELAAAFNAMADSLAQAEQKRSEFVANVSHELKTPMTTISGYVDGILDGTIPEDKREHYLHIVSDETKRLSRLVRSMLDISQLQKEGGIPEEKKMHFDLEECAGQVLITFEKKINDKHLNVNVDMPEHPVYTMANPDYITQVIYNLIDNAVKFCPDGGNLGLRIKEGGSKAYVSVSNDGETIPPDELPLVFDRFHKLDKSRSQNRDGWGLGLYIVKTIVCSHGEDISVSSKDGKTEFTFTMPLVN